MTRSHHQHLGESAAVAAIVDFEPLESRLFMRVEGVDVSQFQGAINWNTLAANGKQFAFVRSSRTTLDKDPNFVTNMTNAKAAGVITGPYHRALPLGDGDAGALVDPVADANRFYNAAKDFIKDGYLRPVLDAEDGATLGKAALNQWWDAFIEEFERLSGVEPIIYANTNYATNLVDASLAAKHDLWIARWNGGNSNQVNPQTDQPETPGGYPNPYGVWNVPIGSTTPSHSSWDFWQYTSNGDGIALGVSSARLDLDVFNGDLEQMRRGFVIGHQWTFTPSGNPFAVGATPITIQAEDYDNGGEGAAYHDTTPNVNSGNAYRFGENSGFDVKLINNTTNQYRLGDTFNGEWVEYSIDVQQAGNYKLDLRLSQADPNAKMHVEIDGANVTGAISVPDTNNFSVFTTLARTLDLPAGKHIVRLAFDQQARNGTVAGVDWLRFSQAPASTTIGTDTASYVRGGTYASWNWGNNQEIVVKRSGTNNTREGYIKFDLGDLSSINSAKLRLTGRLSATTNASLVTNIYSASNTSWTESGLTWNNKPAAGSTLRGKITVSGTTNQTYEVDLTSFLKAELAAGRKVITLVLKNPTASDAQTIFGSDESPAPPQLVVT
jgi:GH25 family lysozyme M1 (1,4-beta-N-acetylmuramidase)